MSIVLTLYSYASHQNPLPLKAGQASSLRHLFPKSSELSQEAPSPNLLHNNTRSVQL